MKRSRVIMEGLSRWVNDANDFVEDLEKELESVREENERVNAKSKKLEKELESVRAENESMKALSNKLEKELASMRTENDTIKAKSNQLEKDLRTENERVKAMNEASVESSRKMEEIRSILGIKVSAPATDDLNRCYLCLSTTSDLDKDMIYHGYNQCRSCGFKSYLCSQCKAERKIKTSDVCLSTDCRRRIHL